MLTLYDNAFSPFARKVRLVLERERLSHFHLAQQPGPPPLQAPARGVEAAGQAAAVDGHDKAQTAPFGLIPGVEFADVLFHLQIELFFFRQEGDAPDRWFAVGHIGLQQPFLYIGS